MQRFIAVVLLTIFTTSRIVIAEAAMSNICPNGRTSVGPYASGLCPAGSTRTPVGNTQLCCGLATSAVVSCVPGSQIGVCIQNGCPQPFVCETFSQQCCISTTTTSIGPCPPDGICPSGFSCFNGACYATDPCTAVDPNLETTGPCVANSCPGPGEICINAETCCGPASITCVAGSQSGPCFNNACQAGFVCETFSQTCCISTTTISMGPCIQDVNGNGICPSGFSCFNGYCYYTQTDPCTAIDPNLEHTGPCGPNFSCPVAGEICINAGQPTETCCGSVTLKMAALARSGLH